MFLISKLLVERKKRNGSRRDSKWPKVRAEHLKNNPNCLACGGDKQLEVHHVVPFHLDKSLELDPNNLVTLCESKSNGVHCHLAFGHIGSFRSFNADVRQDASAWRNKIESRPMPSLPKKLP